MIVYYRVLLEIKKEKIVEDVLLALPVLIIWAMIIVAIIGLAVKHVIAAWKRSK